MITINYVLLRYMSLKPIFFQTEYTDRGSLRGHAQLRNSNTTAILRNSLNCKYKFNQGIFIDIFPMDSVTENQSKFLIQRNQSDVL